MKAIFHTNRSADAPSNGRGSAQARDVSEPQRMIRAQPATAGGAAAAVPKTIWSPPDVLRLLTALAQNTIWLIVAPILGLLVTVAYLLMNDPTYDVGAQVMVRYGQELAAPATVSATRSQQVIPLSKRIEDITGEVQIMKDPTIVREVVDRLGVGFFYGEDEAVTLVQKIKKLIKNTIKGLKEGIRNAFVKIGLLPELSKLDRVVLVLQSSITIEHVTRSDVIEVKIGYPDPDLGAILLREFLDVYLAKRREVFRDDRVTVFFENELVGIAEKLQTAEETYQGLRENNQAWLIEDQRRMAVESRENLLRELEQAQSVINVSQAQIAKLDQELAALDEFVPASNSKTRNLVRDDLRLKLIDLRLALEAEKSRSGVRSQQVQSLEGQIASLQESIAAEPLQITDIQVEEANPMRKSLEAQRKDAELTVVSTQERVRNLQTDIATLEKELRRIGTIGMALAQQFREIERYRDTQISYQRALDDARITTEISAASISNVVVIAEPQGSVAPVKPRVFRLMVISIILSLIAVSGILLVIDALRPKVRSNNDILAFVESPTIVRAVAETERL